jgi:Cytochrome C biogenesis protein transmembrane region
MRQVLPENDSVDIHNRGDKNPMIAAITGLIAGIIHVWSGPDHLAAIAPLAVRQPVRSWVPGIRWGIGHSVGVGLIGLLLLWLRNVIAKDVMSHWNDLLSQWGERIVGIMLIGIGCWALRKAVRIHAHEHAHDGDHHVHLHAHSPNVLHERPAAHVHTHAALGIGILHGLAGSSHFIGVLTALAFPTNAQAVAYLIAFAIGTVFSMATFSWLLGLLTSRRAGGSAKIYRSLMGVCAASAMAVGCFWLLH